MHWSKTNKRAETIAKVIKTLRADNWLGKKRPEMIGNQYAVGTKHTSEWKQANSLRHKGNTNGFKKGFTPWNKGKRFLAISGENNVNWKGGISQQTKTTRQLDMETVEYKNWRISVFTRDSFTCQKCGEIGGKLTANHDLPYSTFPDLRLEVLNGETLCVACHAETTAMQWRCGVLV